MAAIDTLAPPRAAPQDAALALPSRAGERRMNFARTKIQPPRPRGGTLIERPRLEARLAAALQQRRLVLVSAAAGYGKTTALARAAARLPAGAAFAWVAADEGDDLHRLLECLVAALEPFDLPWRTAPEALIAQAEEARGRARAAGELINALEACETPHGVLVLDDLHRVDDGAFFEFMAQVLERLGPRWTVAIGTREDPPLPLARLRAADELAEFRQDELQFDDDEAQALAAALGGRDDALRWHARTQGWPAGLRLALAALRSRPRGSAASAPLVDRHLFDYLAAEVLDDLPPDLHDFLVRTSVLPELTAPRAAAVSGDARAAEQLDELEARGLFATALESAERTLVLHDLFRDALQGRARTRLAAEWPDLLRRAADSEPDPVRRVGYLQQAQDWPAAERALLEVCDEMLLQGRTRELLRLAEAFPLSARSARLATLAAAASIQRWHWEAAVRWAEEALRLAEAQAERDSAGLARAHLATAYYAMDRNPEAEALLAVLAADDTLPPRVRVLSLVADMYQHFRRGEHRQLPLMLGRVIDTLERSGAGLLGWWEGIPAINWTTIAGMPPLFQRYLDGAWSRVGDRPLPIRSELHLIQALLRLWAGRVAEAEAEIAAAEADRVWLAVTGELVDNIGLVRNLVDGMRGRAAAVYATLEAKIAREADASAARRALWVHQNAVYGVRLSDSCGDVAGLEHWAGRLRENPLRDPTSQVPRAVAARARWAAAHRRWDEAVPLFERLLPRLPDMDVMGQRADLTLRAAHAFLQVGRLDDAARTAAGVADRMLAEGTRGHALLCGPQVLHALAEARWGGRLSAAQVGELQAVAALSALLREASAAPAAEAPADDGPLSEREREVLERIAIGDSNKLIARALDISPHTVKRHVANILDKLALASRAQAAAWWRDRGG